MKMTQAISGGLVQLARETLRRLSDAAESASGVDALRNAGYAGGAGLYGAFADSVRTNGEGDPAEMPLDEFSTRAASFFAAAGWGSLTLRSSHDALAVIDVENCWEAELGGGRGCHITTGVLAGFLTPLADYPVAVMEVECGAEGSATCRFLAGNEQMLDDAYQRLVAGESWEMIGAGDL